MSLHLESTGTYFEKCNRAQKYLQTIVFHRIHWVRTDVTR